MCPFRPRACGPQAHGREPAAPRQLLRVRRQDSLPRILMPCANALIFGYRASRAAPMGRRARQARLAGAAPGRLADRPDHPGAAAMTARTARNVPAHAAPDRKARLARPPRAGLRLLRLHAASRRVPAAIAAIAACAIGLRLALLGHWDSYGALQLPLVFEAGCAAAITTTTASPIGEPERVTGRWLPFHDLSAAICGAFVFTIGIVVTSVRGARDSVGE